MVLLLFKYPKDKQYYIDIKLTRALRNKALGEPRTELYQSSAKALHEALYTEALHEALHEAFI